MLVRELKAIDAFCGAGGLSLGLQEAGFNILFSFDIEPLCIETLELNKTYHKHRYEQGDVREMLEGRLLNLAKLSRGELDLLAGGPPCQGFSVQRTVGDDYDHRNLLVDDYGDLILEMMPKFFLLENVTGIGGKRGRAILDKFRRRMSIANYICHDRILDAQEYGVPQRRKRFFLVGQRSDCGADFIWPTHVTDVSRTVRQTIGHLPPAPADGKPHPSLRLHRADKLSKKNLLRIPVSYTHLTLPTIYSV